jgi:hypothetical protein
MRFWPYFRHAWPSSSLLVVTVSTKGLSVLLCARYIGFKFLPSKQKFYFYSSSERRLINKLSDLPYQRYEKLNPTSGQNAGRLSYLTPKKFAKENQ